MNEITDEVIEKCAKKMWNHQSDGSPKWDKLKPGLDDGLKDQMRDMARVVIGEFQKLNK